MEGRDLAENFGQTILDLAKTAILHALKTGAPLKKVPDGLPSELSETGASFVTLHKKGDLRGCIGSPVAWRPLAVDILENAFSAAFRDPRFRPLNPEEWEDIALSVSILTPPKPMQFRDQADLLAQLRPGIDGLIIEDGSKRALFLPAVWSQLPKPEIFLAQLKRKAGMAVDYWSTNFTAQRFEAVEIENH
jgi:AmmeMemoRadiSam system protein A